MARQTWQQLILPIGIVSAILVVLMPLPAPVIDILLIANITIAVVILLTTINVKTPLEFSVFPSLLLAATLGRLVLNVATTRLILTSGHEGASAAGGVIQGFGQFVSSGSILVGAIIFAIIIVIQFVVITKGSTRISEVAARFMLDALPGKQMAIDAELNAGMIDQETAVARRTELEQQSDFFGAMDGASKFVRGDAIAAIVITAINIVGGLAIGIWQGMGPLQAAETFTRLTIGDGLASQIPAFLIALAAGLLVTRSNQKSDLSLDFFTQLVSKPQVWVIAGGFIVALIFTRMPALPLVLIGSGCFGVAYLLNRQDVESDSAQEEIVEPEPAPSVRIEDYLTVDPMEIEIGVGLVPVADPTVGGDLLERINRVRQSIASELGIILPKVRIRDNMNLESDQYRIRIFNNPVAQGTLSMGNLLATNSSLEVLQALEGEDAFEPSSGRVAKWISIDDRDEAVNSGCGILSPAGVLATHLASVSRRNAHLILTREATQHLINEAKKLNPTVVQELIPDPFRLADIQAVLQSLLQENVSVRQLGMILETIGGSDPGQRTRMELVELVRKRLAANICAKVMDAENSLHAIRLQPETESFIADAFDWETQNIKPSVPTEDTELLIEQIELETDLFAESGIAPVLLVSPSVRPILRSLLADRIPGLAILSTSELIPEANVKTLTALQLTASGFSEAC